MKEVTMYKSNDGKIFESKDECHYWENFLLQINTINNYLKSPPEEMETYVKQDKDNVIKFRTAISQLCIDNNIAPIETCKIFIEKNNILLRYLSDSNTNIANKLYELANRCMCIDMDYQEWDQPYYANKYNETIK